MSSLKKISASKAAPQALDAKKIQGPTKGILGRAQAEQHLLPVSEVCPWGGGGTALQWQAIAWHIYPLRHHPFIDASTVSGLAVSYRCLWKWGDPLRMQILAFRTTRWLLALKSEIGEALYTVPRLPLPNKKMGGCIALNAVSRGEGWGHSCIAESSRPRGH